MLKLQVIDVRKHRDREGVMKDGCGKMQERRDAALFIIRHLIIVRNEVWDPFKNTRRVFLARYDRIDYFRALPAVTNDAWLINDYILTEM